MDEAGKELVVDHHHQSGSHGGSSNGNNNSSLDAKVENGETLHHQHHGHHQHQHHGGHLQHHGEHEHQHHHHHHHGDEEDEDEDDDEEDGEEQLQQQQHHQHHTQHQHHLEQQQHHHQPQFNLHQSTAEEVAAHHQQVADLVQQHHHHQQQQQHHQPSYAGLTNEQLQAINAASSSGFAQTQAQAQAQALQHQIHQHLQQQLQGPFPFAYQTLPPLPPPGGVGVPGGNMGVVGMPAHLGGGGNGGLPSHLVNGGGAVGGMPSHLQVSNGGVGSNGGGGGGSASGVNVGVGNIEDAQQIKARPKRKQVKSACLNCRKRKTGCDSFRPCTKCVRNGLESTCMDVPRKKRSSNRSKTNATVTPLSADSSSSSPSSSPALNGVAQPSAPSFASPLSSQLQYMSTVNLPPGMVQGGGIPMPPQTQYTPQLIPMAWANGAQMVSMTWEEITKHVASAQNNSNLALVPPELAWKGNEGVGQHGSMTPTEQSK